MKTFLEYVAEDILSKHGSNLSQIAVVFPNKRASLFLNEYIARLAQKPIWSPTYLTISDLFRSYSQRQVADPIKLVCDLHKSFVSQTGIDETLDHFYGWGQMLLNDFDDIDKQMADAHRVFANLSDLHELDDDSFLTEEQRQVLRRFFNNFSDEHNSELRQRFIRLWSRMEFIYKDFNERLEAHGLAYEGALYREVVSRLHNKNPFPLHENVKCYIFVGFNVLLRVEQQLFTFLHHEGKALFYWDFDKYYMSDIRQHEAGHFLSKYLSDFPNELDSNNPDIYQCFTQPKQINIAASTTENIQARYATQWLRQRQRIADGRRTAIVLCDERLLPAIIHCLPTEMDSVNITTGYPLSQSPMASLVNALIALRRDGYDHQRQHYRIRQVTNLLRHPYLQSSSAQIAPLLEQLRDEKIYFPTEQQLSVDQLTGLLFRHFTQQHQNEELLDWLCDITKAIAHSPATDILREESIFQTYTLLNRLLNLAKSGDLQTDVITLGRLVSQLFQTTASPFHGETIEGLQVMGLLETRCLDFEHLLILSAQEGNMPKGVSDTSVIPYSLRKAYELTTPDHKVAIYSYYFHRLLQRASDITIVYNNSTNDGQKGEISRFLLQLMVEYPPRVPSLTSPITTFALQGGQYQEPRQPQPVENRAQLPAMLTPTAINRYMRCPLQFHYLYVCQLPEPDDDDDDTIDSRIFGNIFHDAAQIVYTRIIEQKGGSFGSTPILTSDIDQRLKNHVDIQMAVDEAFRKNLSHLSKTTHLENRLNGLQIINREVIIHYLRQLLTNDRQLTPFTLINLENDVHTQLEVPGLDKMVTIGGRIDRMDMITDSNGQPHIRVIDYKTGAHRMKPLADVDAIFLQENLKEHSDYYLQAMLYSIIVAQQNPNISVSPALLFIQHAGTNGYDPTLCFGKDTIADVTLYADQFLQQLKSIISKMFDPNVLLTPTEDRHRCKLCPYRSLCY